MQNQHRVNHDKLNAATDFFNSLLGVFAQTRGAPDTDKVAATPSIVFRRVSVTGFLMSVLLQNEPGRQLPWKPAGTRLLR